jgi:hypothetical protein
MELARYIQAEYDSVHRLPREAVFEARSGWTLRPLSSRMGRRLLTLCKRTRPGSSGARPRHGRRAKVWRQQPTAAHHRCAVSRPAVMKVLNSRENPHVRPLPRLTRTRMPTRMCAASGGRPSRRTGGCTTGTCGPGNPHGRSPTDRPVHETLHVVRHEYVAQVNLVHQ